MSHNSSTAFHVGRITFIAILFVTAVSLCISDVNAFPDTVVMVEPSSSSAIVGDTFSVNATVVDVQNLYGFEMTLTWNSTVLRLINIEIRLEQDGGVLNAPTYIAENSTLENRYTLSATSTNPAPSFNGTGSIVCMNFSVIGIGACTLDLQTQLYDYPPPDRDPRFSLPIAHADVDGLFQGVIPEFPYHLVVVVTMVLTLFSAVLSKHISYRRNKTLDKSEQAGDMR